MRRTLFLTMGVLESLVAVVLLGFAWQLPGAAEVHDSVGRVEHVSRDTGAQVRSLRRQLAGLRERRPQMQELAVRLQAQMQTVIESLRGQQIDYATVHTVSDALGDVAKGLDGLSDTLDADGVGQLGKGLHSMADFLDEKVAPAAARAAGQIDQSTEALRVDAKRLHSLLRTAPLDLQAAREIHDSLGRFNQGLGRMSSYFKAERLNTMREGFGGLEDSLTRGAEQVERLAGFTYPVVTFSGIKPVVEQRQFWPEGEEIAEGMRKAAKGATAAAKELEALGEDLPKLQASLDESRKVAERTREALGTALKQQDKVEALLKDVPRHAARLAEELPQLGADLARILKETSRLKEVAGLLRQAQKGIDNAVARWPDLRKDLGRSAVLLRATQGQLKYVVDHREEYEASMRQTLLLAKTFSSALPLLTEQVESELREQEESLATLGGSIDEVSAALPACSRTATRILQTTRLLMVLVAVIFGLHGLHLVFGARLGRRFSP